MHKNDFPAHIICYCKKDLRRHLLKKAKPKFYYHLNHMSKNCAIKVSKKLYLSFVEYGIWLRGIDFLFLVFFFFCFIHFY